MPAENLLEAKHLDVSYQGKRVYSNASLSIKAGEVLTIVGPSGSGKTTLLKSLMLLLFPSRGTIWLREALVYEAEDPRDKAGPVGSYVKSLLGKSRDDIYRRINIPLDQYRRNFGMVFQDFNLWPDYTIAENIAAPLIWNSELSRKEISQRVRECAQIVQIESLVDRYPYEVSTGQRQRAAIARALVGRPDILLLDEVTSALDPELVQEILLLIEGLAQSGITMIIVSHLLQFARRVSNNIVFLANGTLYPSMSPQEFFAASNPPIAAFLSHFQTS
jgi:polar amino acid transport system ATP-binding protein